MSHLNVTTDRDLHCYCRRLAECPWIALDTEFIAERSYRPQLCLVQVAAGDELAIVDPLGIGDMTPFWQVTAEPGREVVVHAGRGELEFCYRALGRLPPKLFDVQVAAGFLGMEYPAGYGTLLARLLGKSSHKAETRTDWRRRPLSHRQVQYALDDVRDLWAIREVIHARLVALDRLAWLEEELAEWQAEVVEALGGERWRRVSGHAGLEPRSLAIVRELWKWRESEAERRDCPVRRVLRDDLIVELARRQTADLKRIQAVRGLERGDLHRALPHLAACIARALDLPDDECPQPVRREAAPQLAVLGQFLFSALGSICRRANLAPALVGTPGDVRDLIAWRAAGGEGEPPLLGRGWRADVVGHLFEDLLVGKLSIRIADPLSDQPLVFEPVGGSASQRAD